MRRVRIHQPVAPLPRADSVLSRQSAGGVASSPRWSPKKLHQEVKRFLGVPPFVSSHGIASNTTTARSKSSAGDSLVALRRGTGSGGGGTPGLLEADRGVFRARRPDGAEVGTAGGDAGPPAPAQGALECVRVSGRTASVVKLAGDPTCFGSGRESPVLSGGPSGREPVVAQSRRDSGRRAGRDLAARTLSFRPALSRGSRGGAYTLPAR
jgi:hypothetical protein